MATARGADQLFGSGKFWYPVTAVAAAVMAAAVLRPWAYGPLDTPLSGDGLWVQAMVMVHGQAGPFGVGEHLGYPAGVSPWALPQLGILLAVLSWLGAGVVGIPAASLVGLFGVLAAALNAAAMLYLLRGVVGNRMGWMAAVLSVLVGAGHWILVNVPVVNLTLFAVVPLTLGILVRWPRLGGAARWAAAVATALAAAASPLWWVIVMFLLLPWLIIAPALHRRWGEVISLLAVLAALLPGLAVQTGLFLVSSGAWSDHGRQAWDSKALAGSLLDLARASPGLNQLVPRLELLAPGSSLWVSWGFTAAVLAAISVMMVLGVAAGTGRLGLSTMTLASAGVVTLLYLLSGGLGVVQAGMAVLLGGESPARWWSRMTLVLAVIGAAWLILGLVRWQRSRGPGRSGPVVGGAAVLAVVLATSWVLDIRADPRPQSTYGRSEQTIAMVGALADRTDPCPVVQVPADRVPSSRVEHSIVGATIYSGLLPYVYAPDYYWTTGTDDPAVEGLTPEMGPGDLDLLREAGYCAVLYDRALGGLAEQQRVAMPGARLSPAIRPDATNVRYHLILLAP